MTLQPHVTWVLPDKMGGAMTVMANLLRHRPHDGVPHHVVLTHNALDGDARCDGAWDAATQTIVEHSLPDENLHAVVRRLRNALPGAAGVLVANDWLELAMASAFDTNRTVVQIVHGDYDYYYDLAERHQDVVDVFVACSAAIATKLCARLPARAQQIRCLPHGVAIPTRHRRTNDTGGVRLIFVGRLVEQKGIFHLPALARALREHDVDVSWTIVGSGPGEVRLREEWPGGNVRWTGMLPHAQVLSLYAEHDVLVLPSRAEGLPLAVLEAMAAGVVPVASDLTGVREIVQTGTSGLLLPSDDVLAFAAAIGMLAAQRATLEQMSRAARHRIAASFDIRERAAAYHALFACHDDLRRPRSAALRMPYGSRLDRPWIPNVAVKAVRAVVRRRQAKVAP